MPTTTSVLEMLQILARVAEDPQRARQIQELLRRDAARSLVLWHVLDAVYLDVQGASGPEAPWTRGRPSTRARRQILG